MRKKLAYLSTVLVASFMASGAQAATIMIDPSVPAGTFENKNVVCTPASTAPCNFTDTVSFVTPTGYTSVSLSIITTLVGTDFTISNPTNIDFGSVFFNGAAFALGPNGFSESGSLGNQLLVAGATNTLTVNGRTGGNAAYSGQISFAQAAAVPEPAAWMLMLIGMAGVGFSMRRKDKPALRVRYT